MVDKSIPNAEGYRLTIAPEGVLVEASSKAGAFYGFESLRQIILNSDGPRIASQNIEDAPRFEWRGLMLDVSRTFMPKELLKRYITLLSNYKMNVLHLHLTDDQGWRVEIKRYPKLTEVGSKFDSKYNQMGGYYTQDDIRELVAFAQQRNVTLVPEIEMPGHACAAIAAYPYLSCRNITPEIHTFFEGPSVHEEIFCAGKESTYEFAKGVIDEIIELFPSKYIHIGGDEAPKAEWEKCPQCQAKMKESNLTNEEELQSYFVRQMGDYISSKGRVLVGWDEIIDGKKLHGTEVVMYWRGWMQKHVAQELRDKNFKVVGSPTSHCYIDYNHETISTQRIHDYEPVIEGTSEANYLGVQANFWSHIDRSEHNIDKQLFPRLLGLSEVGWCQKSTTNWELFKQKAAKESERLKAGFVNVYNDETLK